jgi:hypothetical protein
MMRTSWSSMPLVMTRSPSTTSCVVMPVCSSQRSTYSRRNASNERDFSGSVRRSTMACRTSACASRAAATSSSSCVSPSSVLAAEVPDGRLRIRVHIAEDLRDSVVELVSHVQALARDGQIGELAVEVRVVDRDRGPHGEAFQRLLVAFRERRAAFFLAEIKVTDERSFSRRCSTRSSAVRVISPAPDGALSVVNADGSIQAFITSGVSAAERARIGPPPVGQ